MAHFKSFLFGIFAAYTIYYVTKKGADGKSVIDNLLDNPADFMREAENHLLSNAAAVIKEGLS